ncbi:hypothetical protein PIB30_082466 [Stylosanthes scabra]|uniref:Uncharacterized protein n=1 Tax=Stylosanthes scabra TaxID=79078 RepID=A0ABU6SS89_9FABA|nr:hypothetical protein [Stylosanthes scabra]
MYWTGRVGYDNRSGELTLAALYPYWESMVGDSHSTLWWFEFSPLRISRRTRVLWLECKLGFYSFESDPSFAGSVMLYTEPIGYICMFWKSLVYEQESSVCKVTISAERVHDADSESEGRSKEENPERKLANTLRKMIGLRELDSDDSNLGFPFSTSSSSEEDDVLGDVPGFWDYDDLDDWGTAEPAASSEASCTSHPPPNRYISIMLGAQRIVHILSVG